MSYIDSDTFIDYTPTAYTDIDSPLSPVPPAPNFTFLLNQKEELMARLVLMVFLTLEMSCWV